MLPGFPGSIAKKGENMKSSQIFDLIDMDALEFVDYLAASFCYEIPTEITTVEQAEEASILLAELSNNYSYLLSLSSYLKIYIRQAKSNKDMKTANDYIDKKNAVDAFAEAVKQQYNAISRMITIRSDNLKELHMSDSKYH